MYGVVVDAAFLWVVQEKPRGELYFGRGQIVFGCLWVVIIKAVFISMLAESPVRKECAVGR